MPTHLELIKPKFLKRDHKIVTGTDTIGTLVFKRSFGSLAEAGMGSRCWTFKRVGFFRTRVTVRVCGDQKDIAVFINNTWKGGGTLYLNDGSAYKASSNFWSSEFSFMSPKGKKLLTLKTRGLISTITDISIHKGAEQDICLELLVLLACYIRIMMSEDDGIAASNPAIYG